jgi:hypothetical protein
MASDLQLIEKEIQPEKIRAAAKYVKGAVAVTDKELVTGKAGLFGWGNKVERYPLADLTSVTLRRDSHADLLALTFRGRQENVMLIFQADMREGLPDLMKLLESRVRPQKS